MASILVLMKKKFRLKNIKKTNSNFLSYPQYGTLSIKSLNYGILTALQLESIRKCILRKIKKRGIIWVRSSCIFPITKKSEGSRMGKGKGPIKFYIAHVKAGSILLEMQIFLSKEFLKFLKKLTLKLSINASILLRTYY